MKSKTKLMALFAVSMMLAGGLVFLVPADESDATDGVFESLYPGSWTWDETTGLGPFNSFYAAFDINNGNAFVSVLNPNDLSKKIDGTTLGSGYNIMWVIPTVYWSCSSNNLTLSNDSTKGTAYAHTIDGHTYNYIAIGVYEATSDGNDNPTKLTSETGKMPLVSKTRAEFRTLANTYSMDSTTLGSNAYSMLWNFYQYQLYKYCCLTVMEDFNSQSIVGNGHVYADPRVAAYQTGSTDSMSPYAGNNGLITDNSTGTSYGSNSVKLFIENAWGGVQEFVDGAVVKGSSYLYGDSSHTPMDSTITTYVKEFQINIAGNYYNYPTTIYTGSNFPEIWGLGISGTGSTTTGLSDMVSAGPSGTSQHPVIIGGSEYATATWGLMYGLCYTNLSYEMTSSGSTIGSRLAFVYDGSGAVLSGPSYEYRLNYNNLDMTTTSAAISVANMDPITHDRPVSTATIESNNTDYGTVSTASITDIEPGTAVTISQDGKTLTIGSAGTVTATPTTSTAQYTYALSGWYVNNVALQTGDTIDEDVTIEARFTQALNQYTVTFTAASGGTVSPASVTADYGTQITATDNVVTVGSTPVTATPDTATAQYTYTFDSWTNATGTVTADRTITANFTQTINQYTISFASEDLSYGSVDVSSITADYGTPITVSNNTITIDGTTVTATAEDGFRFVEWTPAPAASVTGTVTYTATFSESVSVTVTFNGNGGTVIGFSTKVVLSGDPIGDLPKADRTNYDFVGWFTAAEGGTQITEDSIIETEEDFTLYAQYKLMDSAATFKMLIYIVPTMLFILIAVGLIGYFNRGRYF